MKPDLNPQNAPDIASPPAPDNQDPGQPAATANSGQDDTAQSPAAADGDAAIDTSSPDPSVYAEQTALLEDIQSQRRAPVPEAAPQAPPPEQPARQCAICLADERLKDITNVGTLCFTCMHHHMGAELERMAFP